MGKKNDKPSKAEMTAGHWMELAGRVLMLGKKIACCPPSDRIPLMDAVDEAAEQFVGDGSS